MTDHCNCSRLNPFLFFPSWVHNVLLVPLWWGHLLRLFWQRLKQIIELLPFLKVLKWWDYPLFLPFLPSSTILSPVFLLSFFSCRKYPVWVSMARLHGLIVFSLYNLFLWCVFTILFLVIWYLPSLSSITERLFKSCNVIYLLSISCPGRLVLHCSEHLWKRGHYQWPYIPRQWGICVEVFLGSRGYYQCNKCKYFLTRKCLRAANGI